MESKKKPLTGTDAIILISIAYFASFIVFLRLLVEMLRPLFKALSILVHAICEGSEAAAEVNNEFTVDSILSWCIYIVFIVYIVFTIIFVFKDKMGLPCITIGGIVALHWIVSTIRSFTSSFGAVDIFIILTNISLILAVAFSIKKYINLKNENDNKPQLTIDNAQ
jgi:hypothetical protein